MLRSKDVQRQYLDLEAEEEKTAQVLALNSQETTIERLKRQKMAREAVRNTFREMFRKIKEEKDKEEQEEKKKQLEEVQRLAKEVEGGKVKMKKSFPLE